MGENVKENFIKNIERGQRGKKYKLYICAYLVIKIKRTYETISKFFGEHETVKHEL
jgi:hypothetical protein